ncbi:hypothetical protein GCM10019059_41210 [Camelimonas fluminis]|nr:hypothetical protein GCM10019059_41210 [Camelimonas fluminis]
MADAGARNGMTRSSYRACCGILNEFRGRLQKGGRRILTLSGGHAWRLWLEVAAGTNGHSGGGVGIRWPPP